MEGKTYRSPWRKLLRFFERSRDGWKRKCLEAKATVKRLSNHVRQLEASRDFWRKRAEQSEAALRQAKDEWEALKNAIA
jgi:predicted  nucleic acid-binding Zn-ribbon protein